MDAFRKDLAALLKGQSVTLSPFTARPTLQCGDTGTHVVYLQGQLNLAKQRLGLSFAKLETDGIFGAKTLYAVKDFQVARNLTVDGIVGKNTWKALGVTYGDVTADGKVSAADALLVLRHTVGKEQLEGQAKSAADMNADGKVPAADATLILKRAVGE